MLRFQDYKYIPLIATRVSEMKALEELPIEAKNGVLPYVVLQQWASSHKLVNTTARLEAAFGGRPLIVDVTTKLKAEGKRHQVHDELDNLRDSTDGFRNWYDFLEGFPNFIPSLQISNPTQIPAQIFRAVSLGRGLAIRLHRQVFDSAELIAQLVAPQLARTPIIFILDYGHGGREILLKAVEAVGMINAIRKYLPHSIFSVAACSFPSSLVGLDSQQIFERDFHDQVCAHIGPASMVYSDRASARNETGGGGGTPAPRVDNALNSHWLFYRQPEYTVKQKAYEKAAVLAIKALQWIDLGIWGTNRIKETAAGGKDVIKSPRTSTTVRMNIHMYQQSMQGKLSPEVEWTD